MKFEKFLKIAGGRGIIVDSDGEKWLLYESTMLRVPETVNVIAALRMSEPRFMRQAFEEFAAENTITANLSGAELPTPDASASKIIRLFSDDEGGTVGIGNKEFSIIEKSDNVYTVYDDTFSQHDPAGLLITTGYGESEEITGLIFDPEYFGQKINEKE